MKISVDGGALDQKDNRGFGTSIVSENLIEALKLYDKKNQYFVYTFDNLRPKFLWMKGRVSIEELRSKKDIFLAVNQAMPLFTSGKIISICHGLSYLFYPQHYPKAHINRMNGQLNEMIKRSDKIIVSSERVEREFLKFYPDIGQRLIVLPFGLPFDMVKGKIVKKQKYFLFVGNNQEIKNVDFVVDAFVKSGLNRKEYRLILIGDRSKYENINRGIASTGNISRARLKKYYQKATALLTASYYESFNLPVLEALAQRCPVIGLESAIIPELKEYVNVAGNLEEFIADMKEISVKPNVQSINRLYKIFDWKNYVGNLVRLYK